MALMCMHIVDVQLDWLIAVFLPPYQVNRWYRGISAKLLYVHSLNHLCKSEVSKHCISLCLSFWSYLLAFPLIKLEFDFESLNFFLIDYKSRWVEVNVMPLCHIKNVNHDVFVMNSGGTLPFKDSSNEISLKTSMTRHLLINKYPF